MISIRTVQVRFGWISPPENYTRPDVLLKEVPKVTRTELPNLMSVTAKDFSTTCAKEAEAAGLEQVAPFIRSRRFSHFWELFLIEDIRFPLEKALELQRDPDIRTFADSSGIKWWEVTSLEALKKLSTTLRDHFTVSPRITTGTAFPELDPMRDETFKATVAKEVKAARLDQFPSSVGVQRYPMYWRVIVPARLKFPPEKALEFNRKMGREIRAFGYSRGISNDEMFMETLKKYGVLYWDVYTVEGLVELSRVLREHIAAQAEEKAKISQTLPTSWTMIVNIPKANRRQQQRLNQMVQLLADDMLHGETPDRNQQQLTQKTKLKESGK